MELNRQELTALYANLKRQINTVLDKDGAVHAIEVDIVKDTLRKMYELLQVDTKLPVEDKQNKAEELSSAPEAELVEELPSQPESIEENVDREEEELLEAVEQEFSLKFEARDEEKVEEPELPVEAQKDPELTEMKTEAETLAPKQAEKVDVNQAASSKNEKTLGERITKNPISSLIKQVSINDKFLFTNELFKGKMKIYNQHIAKLDEMNALDEALSYLENLEKEYAWNVEEEAYEQFVNYIQRRFVNV